LRETVCGGGQSREPRDGVRRGAVEGDSVWRGAVEEDGVWRGAVERDGV
jgi:hypothetical protein